MEVKPVPRSSALGLPCYRFETRTLVQEVYLGYDHTKPKKEIAKNAKKDKPSSKACEKCTE